MDPPPIKSRPIESKYNLLSNVKKPIPTPRDRKSEQFSNSQTSGYNINKINKESSYFNNLEPNSTDKFTSFEYNNTFYPSILNNQDELRHDTRFMSLTCDELYGRFSIPTSVEYESGLSKYRKELQQMVKNNAPADDKYQVVHNILKLDQSINSKYVVLDIDSLLDSNKDGDLSKIPDAFNVLEKYAANLLKEETERYFSWRKITTYSSVFKNTMRFVNGVDKVIERMGYINKDILPTGDISSFVFPVNATPNKVILMDLVVDLLIAKHEIDSLLNGSHPCFEKLSLTGTIPDVYFTHCNSFNNRDRSFEQKDSLGYDSPSMELVLNQPGLVNMSLTSADPKIPVIFNSSSNETSSQKQGHFQCPNCNSQFHTQPRYCSNCGYQTDVGNQDIFNRQSLEVVQTEQKQQHSKNSLLQQKFEQENFKTFKGWNCKHCTFLNDSTVSICQACYRTSFDEYKSELMEPQKAETKTPLNYKQSDKKDQIQNSIRYREYMQQEKEMRLRQEKEQQRQMVIATQNKMKQNALNVAKILQMAEREGFSIQFCEIALLSVETNEWSHIKMWIKEQLPRLTNELMEYSKQAFSAQTQILSKKEAHQFLYDFNVDLRLAFEAFKKKREKQLKDLMAKFGVTELEIHKALFDSEGNQSIAEGFFFRSINAHCIRDSLNTNKAFIEKLKDPNILKDTKCCLILGEHPKLSWGKAENCLKLINLNTYSVEDCLEAVENNLFYDDCIKFLSCPCCMCYEECPRHKLTSNIHCQCQYCIDCYVQFLDVTITQQHIRNLVCANCQLPTEEAAIKTCYFEILDSQFRHYVSSNKLTPECYSLFQEKLRDFTLVSNENFRWCAHCPSYGFLWENDDIRMQCNKCNLFTCFLCKEKWLPQHDGISCEKFSEWKIANDPELQTACAADMLSKNGIECPQCHFKYILVRGGCMHFTCNQCGYEFCSGCSMGFLKGARCQVNPECAGKGLHAHHPRDCYFYLRDRTVDDLRKLLEKNNVEFETKRPEDKSDAPFKCTIPISEEYLDKPCGNDSPDNMAGLCENHFKEYLVTLVNKNNLDPVFLLSVDELSVVLTRSYKKVLVKNADEVDEEFHKRLQEYVRTELPLLPRK